MARSYERMMLVVNDRLAKLPADAPPARVFRALRPRPCPESWPYKMYLRAKRDRLRAMFPKLVADLERFAKKRWPDADRADHERQLPLFDECPPPQEVPPAYAA